MTQPTPDQLERARKAAAAYWQTGDVGDESSARSILSGEWDDMAYTQAALSAILQSDQQQAELLQLMEAMAGALEQAIREASLLHQNSLACAVDHYGHDYELHGEPTWLADSRQKIADAREPLTAFREWQGGRSDG